MSKPRKRLLRRPFVILLTLAVLAGAGYFAWQGWLAPRPSTLITAPVTRGDIEESVLATGTLKPVKLIAVGAQVSGRITTVAVQLGQAVKAGDLIAQIDSVPQQNSLRTAEANLANVTAQLAERQATLALNQQTLVRQRNMVAQNAVSKADFESAEAAVNVTLAQIEALKAQIKEAEVGVETARANLGYTRITAPIEGTVLAIVSQEGQTVNAAQSAPTIVILGQLETMTVRTEISEADITRVKPGLPVYFTVLGGSKRRFNATLESIEPAPESIRSDSSFSSSTSSSSSSSSSSSTSSSAIYYNGVFNVPNPRGQLKTYMTAEVHIVLGKAEGVLTVPSTALGSTRRDGSSSVRVVDKDGRVSERQIQVGLNDKVRAEVRSGLEEGERVVIGEGSGQDAGGAATKGQGGPGRRMPPPRMGL